MEPRRAHLVLRDGSVFTGTALGTLADSDRPANGEVVFNTSMTGYQEMLTDPSYAGQIVVPTYPLIGNYGTNDRDDESARVQVAGFAVRQECATPSHFASAETLHEYLARRGTAAITGVDTRAITRRIRAHGVMMGTITTLETPNEALDRLAALPAYDAVDFVQHVTTRERFAWPGGLPGGPRIAVVDSGVKYNILRELARRGCYAEVLPSNVDVNTVLALRPDGVVFSPGPGDPAHNVATVATARALIGHVPVLGICLGHQIVARAMGAQTFKLKFGHRGGNHPVQNLVTGRITITAQNHGFAVDETSLPRELEVTHRNLNDGTVEGLRHRNEPVRTIQYHSEASPGPLDNVSLFDDFLALVTAR